MDGFITQSTPPNTNSGCITIGNETAKPFVQKGNFYTGTKVNILLPILPMNEYTLQFITKMIEQQKEKYSYSFTINSTRLQNQKILLPITPNGTPHWQLMENHMRHHANKIIARFLAHLK